MKVLLLNPPFPEMLLRDNYCCHTSKGDYVWAPTDLLYVSGNLSHPDIEQKVIDAIVEKKSSEKVIAEIEDFQPDVIVALSGTASFVSDMELLAKVKDRIKCRLYVMGNIAAFEPRAFLNKFPMIDGIFHNFFDEKILPFVLNPLHTAKSISARLPDGSIILGEVNYLGKHEIPQPLPPNYSLFPLHLYSTPISLRSPMASVITSFGCPYVCKFCVASGLNLYHRSIENIELEFDEIHRNGVREIFFMDSTFNTSHARVREICELMLKKNYGFTWSCNVHSHRNLNQTFTLMKKAGCHTIQIG
ncbi:MAG: radical SAM protein [Bacteroidetes bacterium]|nr:radical SAM protein [Bacteroidota bacterium]